MAEQPVEEADGAGNQPQDSTVAQEWLSPDALICRAKMNVAWRPDSQAMAVAAGDEIRLWCPFDDQKPSRSKDLGDQARLLAWHPGSGLADLSAGEALVSYLSSTLLSNVSVDSQLGRSDELRPG